MTAPEPAQNAETVRPTRYQVDQLHPHRTAVIYVTPPTAEERRGVAPIVADLLAGTPNENARLYVLSLLIERHPDDWAAAVAFDESARKFGYVHRSERALSTAVLVPEDAGQLVLECEGVCGL